MCDQILGVVQEVLCMEVLSGCVLTVSPPSKGKAVACVHIDAFPASTAHSLVFQQTSQSPPRSPITPSVDSALLFSLKPSLPLTALYDGALYRLPTSQPSFSCIP
ncbi:hypothetical protein EON65_11980, partial [archaeon]